MNGYNLSREWWDFAFDNPDRVRPIHSALYFFIIEHFNRLGWKEKAGLPTSYAAEAVGIKSIHTFINTLNDLVDFGFVIMVQKAKNQYQSNIIALSKNDKASARQVTKQMQSKCKANAWQLTKHLQSNCKATAP